MPEPGDGECSGSDLGSRSGSVYFEIENSSLRIGSPLPRHVAQRFANPEASPKQKRAVSSKRNKKPSKGPETPQSATSMEVDTVAETDEFGAAIIDARSSEVYNRQRGRQTLLARGNVSPKKRGFEEANDNESKTFSSRGTDAEMDLGYGDDDGESDGVEDEYEDDDNDTNYISNLERTAANRERILRQRKERISRRMRHIQNAAAEARVRIRSESSALRESLDVAMSDADRKREEIYASRRSASAQRNARVRQAQLSRQMRDNQERDAWRRSIDAKMRKSQWRRQQIAKISRSTLVNTATLEEAIKLHAVMQIQAWLRFKRLFPLLCAYRMLRISKHDLSSLEFAQVAKQLQSKRVLDVTQKLLDSMLLSAIDPPDQLKDRPPSMARIFLTHIVILTHANAIVENTDGSLEKELMDTARSLAESLDALLTYHPQKSRISFHTLVSAVLQFWFSFHVTFESFKKKDIEGVINNLVAHGLELARLLANVTSYQSNEADAEFRPNIESQLRLTKRRLKNIGGAAAIDALNSAFDAENLLQFLGPPGSSRAPSPIPADSVLLSSPSRIQIQRPQQTAAPQAGPSPLSRASGAATSGTAETAALPRPRQSAAATHAHSNERIKNIIENHALAHELIMDPDFSLKPTPDPHNIRQIANKALYNHIQELIQQGKLDFLPNIIAEIRDNLVSLCGESARMAQIVKEQIDPELSATQIENKAFDFAEFLRALIAIMMRIAAPARDNEINELAAMTSIADVVIKVKSVLDNMMLDLCNYQLRLLRPVLQTRIIPYEAEKFAEFLQARENEGIDGLSRTRQWLSNCVDEQLRTRSERNPENIPLPPEIMIPKFEDVFHDAVLQLATANSGNYFRAAAEKLPETFSLDSNRICDFQRQAQAIVAAASTVLISRTAFPTQFRSIDESNRSPAQLAHAVLHIFELNKAANSRESETISDAVAGAIAAFINATSSEDSANTLLLAARACGRRSDPVTNILQRRVATVLRHWLANGSRPSAETITSYGLDVVSRALDDLGHKIAILAKHNKSVYAKWYDEILRSLLEISEGNPQE